MTWSAADYALYWSYVNNIWVHNHTERMTKKKIQKSYWYCRLWKNDADIKSEGHERRVKRMRLTDFCFMKLALIKRFDETTDHLLSVKLNCHINKKFDSAINQRQHNHTLKFFDSIKINFAIKLTADQKMTKKYTLVAMNRNMQKIKWKKIMKFWNRLKNKISIEKRFITLKKISKKIILMPAFEKRKMIDAIN